MATRILIVHTYDLLEDKHIDYVTIDNFYQFLMESN